MSAESRSPRDRCAAKRPDLDLAADPAEQHHVVRAVAVEVRRPAHVPLFADRERAAIEHAGLYDDAAVQQPEDELTRARVLPQQVGRPVAVVVAGPDQIGARGGIREREHARDVAAIHHPEPQRIAAAHDQIGLAVAVEVARDAPADLASGRGGGRRLRRWWAGRRRWRRERGDEVDRQRRR